VGRPGFCWLHADFYNAVYITVSFVCRVWLHVVLRGVTSWQAESGDLPQMTCHQHQQQLQLLDYIPSSDQNNDGLQ